MATRRFRQYQSIAPEIFVVPVDVVALDWLPTYPLILPAARQIVAPPSLSFVEIEDVVPLLSWSPTYVDRLLRARRAPVGEFVLGQAPLDVAISLDWLPAFPDVLRRLRRPADLPALALPIFVEPALTSEIPWLSTYPNTLRRARLTDRGFFVNGRDADAPVVVPDGLPWAPTFPDILRRLRRLAFHDDSSIFAVQQELVSDGTAVAGPMGLRRRFLFHSFVEPLVTLSNFALDWRPTYPSTLRRARRPALGWFSFQSFDSLVDENTQKSRWHPTYPVRLLRLRRTPPPSFFMHLSTPIIPSIAAWEPGFPDRLRSSRIDRRLIPSASVGPVLPIPDVGGGTVLNYRQQKSWYRSSSG